MSLVALALPQDTLRMKTMAEKEENPPLGDDPVAISAKGKAKKDKHKHKEAAKALVQTSTPAISIAIPDSSSAVLQGTHSAPCSPEVENSYLKKPKQKHKRGQLHLPRLHSPLGRRRHANSDPETSSNSVSPSPSPSPSPVSSPSRPPRFLWIRAHRKKNSPREMNGDKTPSPRSDSPNVVDGLSGSSSSIEPEATPVTTLPGQIPTRNSGGEIPTIFVSHETAVGEHNGTEVEESEHRKMSQTSQGSTLHSGNSGYCSQLSPTGSGDECGSYSDLDCPSPLSPPSIASSPGGSAPDLALFSADRVDKDGPRVRPRRCSLVSPESETEPQIGAVTTPTSARGMSPPVDLESRRGSSDSRSKDPLKKKSRPWERVRKFVQALSPFTLQFNKKRYEWVQLAGHQDSFRPGVQAGSIQKRSDQRESSALKALATDSLRTFVPEYIRTVERDGVLFVEMADLLREFNDPAVMDIKMGVRTYLEEELEKARTKKVLRKDMYEKMIAIDPNEPTSDEHNQQAITKPRYMQWRETISSSSSLGFRIEGIKTSEGKALKDFKTTRHAEEVKSALRDFISENPNVKEPFLRRLHEIRSGLEQSEFFQNHEVIGSSLLFVYDSTDLCSVHLIDFGKTISLPPGVSINHRSPWEEGNHEDGYLWGLDNLIELWRDL